MSKTEDDVNSVYLPIMSDKALADMYGKTPTDKLISMIVENIAGGFKFTKEELKTILSKCLPTTLVDLMCPIHRFNETRKIDVKHIVGQVSFSMTPEGSQQEPDVNKLTSTTKYIPYQLCPKCNGTGKMAIPLDYAWVWGIPLRFTSETGSYTCDVCNGAKIISMHELRNKLDKETLKS